MIIRYGMIMQYHNCIIPCVNDIMMHDNETVFVQFDLIRKADNICIYIFATLNVMFCVVLTERLLSGFNFTVI